MGRPLPLTAMFVLAVFVASGGIIWLAHGDSSVVIGEPPLIRASQEPLKRNPDDPGGRRVPDLGGVGDLLAGQPGESPEERLMPSPEQPMSPAEAAVASLTEGVAIEELIDDPAQHEDAREALQALVNELRADGPNGGVGGPPSARLPTPERPGDPVAETAIETVSANPSRQADLAAEEAGDEGDANAVLNELRLAAASDGAEPQFQDAPLGGQFRVQLAAVREEEDARRAWALFEDRLGAYVDGLQPFFEVANTDNGTFYRVQIGPFFDGADANALCEELQKQDASCFVIRR